jgi:uncharacterized membrane protein (UPF0136 family)
MTSKRSLAAWIIGYGLFLAVIGLLGFMSNPEKARTALISGGTFGALSIVWGVLTALRMAWAPAAAMVTTGFLLVIFTWRASAGWLAYFGGETDKVVAASLISTMWLGSVVLLTVLFRDRRRRRTG